MPKTLTQLSQPESQRLWHSQTPLPELLQIHNVREGLYLPVMFEIYPNYLKSCHYNQEIIIGNPKYREVLDKRIPHDYFDNPRTLKPSK